MSCAYKKEIWPIKRLSFLRRLHGAISITIQLELRDTRTGCSQNSSEGSRLFALFSLRAVKEEKTFLLKERY